MSAEIVGYTITLVKRARYGKGKLTFERDTPLPTTDPELVAWASSLDEFKVEPVLSPAEDLEKAPKTLGRNIKLSVQVDPDKIAEAVVKNMKAGAGDDETHEPVNKAEEPAGDTTEVSADAPTEEPKADPAGGQAEAEDSEPERTKSDDFLEALLGESIREIEPRLKEMTTADLEKLRELEKARADTRSTLLAEIDQELRKKG